MKGYRDDPRLKELSNSIIEISNETKVESKKIILSTVQELWLESTVEKIENDPLFYEKEVATVPRLTLVQFKESLKKRNVPQEIIENLSLVDVDYRGFNDVIYHGQIIIHKDLVSSISNIFRRILLETKFPITSLIPVSMFNWSDPNSMKYNNTSAFNWRKVAGSDEVSDHAIGCAIDINPLQGPWEKNVKDAPKRDTSIRGLIHPDSKVVEIFKSNGWKWGGDWKYSKDWQHFYRPEIFFKYFGKHEADE